MSSTDLAADDLSVVLVDYAWRVVISKSHGQRRDVLTLDKAEANKLLLLLSDAVLKMSA